MSNKVPKVPAPSVGDTAHRIARMAIGSLPVVGGSAVELFQWVIQPPLDQRREEWMAQVGELLEELSQKGVDLNGLRDDPEFITVVVHASQIAIKSHQEFKRDALRNVIHNFVNGQTIDDSIRHVFIDLIDTFSEWHIRILRVFQAPPPVPGLSIGGLSDVLERSLPELRNRRAIYDQFWRDLHTRGLVNTEGLHVTMSQSGLSERRTTPLGDQFLDFITSP